MHSLRSSSQSYTASSVSSHQFSSSVSRSSQQSSVSCESSSSKTWQIHKSSTTLETNFSSMTFSQHTESMSSVLASDSSDGLCIGSPPALPQKTRSRRRKDRQLSQYDNISTDGTENETQQDHVVSCSMHMVKHSGCRSPDGKPPPLPPKKKHSKYCLI